MAPNGGYLGPNRGYEEGLGTWPSEVGCSKDCRLQRKALDQRFGETAQLNCMFILGKSGGQVEPRREFQKVAGHGAD